MDPRTFSTGKGGRVIKHPSGYWAYLPNALPRELSYSSEVGAILSVADRRIGTLDGLCYRLPNAYQLSGAYVAREATLSSRIEGTQSTASDLYLFEIEPEAAQRPADVQEVANYVTALNYALLRKDELPVSLRLIREVHARLMRGVRGRDKTPGEFRRSQNWIGGGNPENAIYVPPPVDDMQILLDDLEKFLHRPHPEGIPPLLECALVHYQFEAVHPFLDGNGRIGRLLITLLVIERRCLSLPLLYLSAYFEKHREEYYDQLLTVSQTGNWTAWLLFFLRGVAEQADDAVKRAARVLDLRQRYSELDVSPTALRLVEQLLKNPFVSIKSVSEALKVTRASASKAIEQLRTERVLHYYPPRRAQGQRYVAKELLDAFTREM
jgi:Fic family protein